MYGNATMSKTVKRAGSLLGIRKDERVNVSFADNLPAASHLHERGRLYHATSESGIETLLYRDEFDLDAGVYMVGDIVQLLYRKNKPIARVTHISYSGDSYYLSDLWGESIERRPLVLWGPATMRLIARGKR